MKKYTEKIHAKRLLGILARNIPCECCPRGRHYDGDSDVRYGEMWANSEEVCNICTSFIGLKSISKGGKVCPCHRLGAGAIKRTWKVLEAKGYL